MKLTVDLCGVEVEVDVYVEPPSRGSCDRWGQQMEPDDPGCVEINSVMCGGYDILDLLSERAFGILDEKCCELVDEMARDKEAAQADAEYEEWKERQWLREQEEG